MRVVSCGKDRPFPCRQKMYFSFVFPCTWGNLAELGSCADGMREEGAVQVHWCRQLDGGDQTSSTVQQRGVIPSACVKRVRVWVVISNSIWHVHTLDPPFCSYSDIPNPSPMKGIPAQPPKCWPDGGETNYRLG